MSQMPEMPATGWAEQGYDPSAYPQQADAQSPQAQTTAVWQQDTEPDWGASQYPEYPAQQGYPAGPAAAAAGAQPPPLAADSGSGLPTEFDHLFRDSTPDSRRAIDRQKPMVGGASVGYMASSQAVAAPPAVPEGAIAEQAGPAPYQAYQQPYPQQADPFAGPAQYQGTQFPGPSGQYPQADYQQGGGYGEPAGAFGGGGFGGGGSLADRLRNHRTLAIGGAVAVAVVIGITIAMSGGSPSGSGSAASGGTPSAAASRTTPKQQADQIYQLIEQSSQLRSDANTAVVDVNGCKNLASAQSMLAATAQKRQSQADSVGRLDVSGIQNGALLVSQLKAAWTASAQYDTAYSQIAGDMQGGCKTSAVRKDSNYQAANQAAGAADDAKAQAARLWNDNVAAPLGESPVTSDKL